MSREIAGNGSTPGPRQRQMGVSWPLLVGGCLPERLLLCASDLSTRRQRNGHAMVTTGTED